MLYDILRICHLYEYCEHYNWRKPKRNLSPYGEWVWGKTTTIRKLLRTFLSWAGDKVSMAVLEHHSDRIGETGPGV